MDVFAARAGAYVHIPFCSAICPYCDFAVVAGRDDMTARYRDAVTTEIGRDKSWRVLSAVYFGGGTPSRMPASGLAAILGALRQKYGIAGDAEVSLEANPEDFTAQSAAELLEAGFNRVSFGAQSFDNEVLLALGRRHDRDQVASAVAIARVAGFENISVDLIYGTPGETNGSWRATVESGVAVNPDHVSCYALTVEPGTPLGRAVRDGAPEPDPDVQVDRFEVADTLLSAAGLERYEVSNWSLPERECAYNAIVWAQGEYVAYGNGAHRFRDAVRSRNIRRFDSYLAAIEAGAPPVAGEDPIAGWDAELDRMFVGLRRSAGVATGRGGAALLRSASGMALTEAGILGEDGGRVRVLEPMLTDEVLRAVLDLEDPQHADHISDADNVCSEVTDA